MANGDGNGNGNGTLRRVLISVVTTICGALVLSIIFGLMSVRDRLATLENSWSVGNGAQGQIELRRDVDRNTANIQALQEWKSEGARFTKADAEKLREDLQRQIDELRKDARRR